MTIVQTTLKPVDQLADLARLCARLATPFASSQRVLADAGVAPAQLDEARARWRSQILGDPLAAQQFREAYASERARIRGEAPKPSAPTSPRHVPLSAPAQPEPEVNVDETAFGARVDLRPALPFAKGDFKPDALPTRDRPRDDAFDPDSTLPLRSPDERDPTTPFVKLLPSMTYKKPSR